MHELIIEGVIGAGFWGDVSSSMIRDELRAAGGADLNVYINSIGGDVFEGVAILNQLRRHEGHVKVTVDGIAASIASVIAMGGDEVVMGTGSQFMIHAPWTATIGDSVDHQRAIEALNSSKVSILDAYQTRAGVDREQLESWVDAETWFSAEEAVDHGFADSIAQPAGKAGTVASVPMDLYRNTPAALLDASQKEPEIEAKVWQATVMGMRAELLRRS